MGPLTIRDAFRDYFRIIPAYTEELREEVFRIRYQVYCEELAFENKNNFADGLEFDSHDAFSKHCLLRHIPSGKYAGTVRLVLSNPDQPNHPFPFESACGNSLDKNIVDPQTLNRSTFGEISRLAVISDFRRRKGESSVPDGDVSADSPFSLDDRRRFPHIALGLYLAGASLGLLQGLSSVFVMMEPRLARRLTHYGIVFQQVGGLVYHHGRRGPFRITRTDLYSKLRPEMRNLLDFITQELRANQLKSA